MGGSLLKPTAGPPSLTAKSQGMATGTLEVRQPHHGKPGTGNRPLRGRPRHLPQGGRALFYVYTEAGERVAEKLIREGLGKAWEGDGQHGELFMGVENVRRGMATEGYR